MASNCIFKNSCAVADDLFNQRYNQICNLVRVDVNGYLCLNQGNGVLTQVLKYIALRRFAKNDKENMTILTAYLTENDYRHIAGELIGGIGICFIVESSKKKILEGFVKEEFSSKVLSDTYDENYEVYINEKLKQTLVVSNVQYINSRKQPDVEAHVSAMIPRIAPWLASPEEIKEDKEFYEFFKSLSKFDSLAFYKSVNKLLKDVNAKLKETIVERSVGAMMKSSITRQINNLIDSIGRCNTEIEEYMWYVNERMAQIEKYKDELEGLKMYGESKIMNEKIENLIGIFKSYKNIDIVYSNQSSLSYTVKTTIDYIDSDVYESYKNNPHSWVNRKKDLIPLWDALFLDRRYKVKIMGGWQIQSGTSVSLCSNAISQDPDRRGYAPNPHLSRYSCLGQNLGEIEKYIRDGNLVGAINQSIASTKNLSLSDTAVMEAFMDYSIPQNFDNFILIDKDGNEFSPRTVIGILEKERESKNGETTES